MKPEYEVAWHIYFGNTNYNKNSADYEHRVDSVRRIVRDGLAEVRPWNEMSPLEQDFFVYITIRERMLKYVEKCFQKKVRDKVDAQTKSKHDELISIAHETIELLEDNIPFVFKHYDTSSMTDKEAKAAYQEFCAALTIRNERCPIPPYETWRKDHQNNPRRPYDYAKEFEECNPNEADDDEPSESEIDHVILHTLLKYLLDNDSLQIDIEKIRTCLAIEKRYSIEDFVSADRNDPKLRQYLNAKVELKNYNFIIGETNN